MTGLNFSGGPGTTLPDFAESHRLGLPQPHYHGKCHEAGYCIPESRLVTEGSKDLADIRCTISEGSSENWSLHLRFLVLESGPDHIVVGWGKSLKNAYDNYVGGLKFRSVVVRGYRKVLVPGDLTP